MVMLVSFFSFLFLFPTKPSQVTPLYIYISTNPSIGECGAGHLAVVFIPIHRNPAAGADVEGVGLFLPRGRESTSTGEIEIETETECEIGEGEEEESDDDDAVMMVLDSYKGVLIEWTIYFVYGY